MEKAWIPPVILFKFTNYWDGNHSLQLSQQWFWKRIHLFLGQTWFTLNSILNISWSFLKNLLKIFGFFFSTFLWSITDETIEQISILWYSKDLFLNLLLYFQRSQKIKVSNHIHILLFCIFLHLFIVEGTRNQILKNFETIKNDKIYSANLQG